MGAPTPPDPLPPPEGSAEVRPRSFAEQMGPIWGAEVLRGDGLKKDVSFCGSVKQRGKIYRDASKWGFGVCVPSDGVCSVGEDLGGL